MFAPKNVFLHKENEVFLEYTVKRQHHILLTKVQISNGAEIILHGQFQQAHVAVNWGC